MVSLLAEALDHVEMQNGFRANGLSASINSIIQTVVMGLDQTLVLCRNPYGRLFCLRCHHAVL
ncbi:MAG: hypothetical protein K2P30_05160 [Lachnospiraceae bacterium]|nr:hypothetical protein [Lachnospiraceae bacterium]